MYALGTRRNAHSFSFTQNGKGKPEYNLQQKILKEGIHELTFIFWINNSHSRPINVVIKKTPT